jgi:hypothetical protein
MPFRVKNALIDKQKEIHTMISSAKPTNSAGLAQIKVAPYQISNLNANPCKDLKFRNFAKSHKKRRN